MRTVDAIVGNEDLIINAYGLPPVTQGKHYKGACPLCGKKHKFRMHFNNGSLRYICVCSHGSLFDLLLRYTGKQFSELAKELDTLLGNTFKSDKPIEKKPSYTHEFAKLPELRGTQAQQYLQSRGIFSLPKRGIRYSDNIKDSQGMMQGMIAVATDEFRNPCYEHRTYLADGCKAQVETNKKMFTLKKMDNVSVKMFDADICLGIAEGIETALSAHQIYQMPTWATMNSGFMKKFKAPANVEKLYIFADNDENGTGLAAAFECANKNILSNNDVKEVIVRWPMQSGDFNDVLLGGIQVTEWVLKCSQNSKQQG